MPATNRSSSSKKTGMEAAVYDFTELANQTRVDATQSKRALERGNSDAKPPVAKAKPAATTEEHAVAAAASIPIPGGDAPMHMTDTSKDPQEGGQVLQLLTQLVSRVDTIALAVSEIADIKKSVGKLQGEMTNLQTDMEDVKTYVSKAVEKSMRT